MSTRNPLNIFRILAPSDRLVLQWIEAICSDLNAHINIQLAGYSSYSVSSKEWLSEIDTVKDIKVLLGDAGGTLITRAFVECGKTRATFERVVTSYRESGGQVLLPSLYEAEIFFSDSNAEGERYDLELRSTSQRIFKTPSPKDLAAGKYHSAIGKEVTELASLSRSLIKEIKDEQFRLLDQSRKERQALVDEFENEKQGLYASIESDREELKKYSSDLERREKSLQLQEFKHERRQIRKSITEKIQTRLRRGRSVSSLLSRMAVLLLCIAGILVGTALAYSAAINGSVSSLISDGLSVGEAIDLLKIFGGGLVSITLVFYALNFWRKKVDEDERHERLLERYSLDIDRGSWIVETVLDIRSENPDAEIPDLWLQGVSSGLFPASSDSSDDKEDAVDALGVLLKKGAHFKLGPNGAEFELSEKAAKRVGRDAD